MKIRRRRNSDFDDNSGAAQDRPPLLNFGRKDNLRDNKSGQRGTKESVQLSWNHIPGQNCWVAAVIAAGVLLALVIGLFHAWCVYSIHENLLWFSQLKVSRRRICLRFCCKNVEWETVLNEVNVNVMSWPLGHFLFNQFSLCNLPLLLFFSIFILLYLKIASCIWVFQEKIIVEAVLWRTIKMRLLKTNFIWL